MVTLTVGQAFISSTVGGGGTACSVYSCGRGACVIDSASSFQSLGQG